MRLSTLRRHRATPEAPGIVGTARVADAPADPQRSGGPAAPVAQVARRARRGDIAVVDVLDLDAASARLLVGAGVAAVVNAAPSISGRYPARGAEVLVDAGVPLLDRVGPEVLRTVRNGDRVRLDGALLHRGDDVVARGEPLGPEAVRSLRDRAAAGLAVQLAAFAANTAEHLRTEQDVYLDGAAVPALRTDLAGRDVVVVSAGAGCDDDLRRLKPWLREHRPVLVGVDEGADVLCAAGLRPDLVVGNVEVVSEEVLLGGPEVVVRGHRGGGAPGADRAEALGASTTVFTFGGTSEDAALVLAARGDAALVVLVGSALAATDFADRARADLAGSFLSRLLVGPRLVDAATVVRLHRPPAASWPLWLLALLLLAGIVGVAALAGDATPVGQWRADLLEDVRRLWEAVT